MFPVETVKSILYDIHYARDMIERWKLAGLATSTWMMMLRALEIARVPSRFADAS